MPKRPVYWYEGMFLRPHHFQAGEGFVLDRIREGEEWLHPHAWGLRQLEIDADALKNHRVVVSKCQARLRDGTTLTIPDEGQVEPFDLRASKAFEESATPTVVLAIPRDRRGIAGVQSAASPGGDARYAVHTLEIPDANTGADEEMIDFRGLRPSLLAAGPEREGYEMLPLARFRRSASDPAAPPEVDPTYIPPLLALEGWTPLAREAREFWEYLRSVVRNEADYLIGRKISFDSQVIGESERILKLMACNTALTPLESVFRQPALHPFLLYTELCRLVGQLGLFETNRRPPEVPSYDHDDLGTIFPRVFDELRRMLGQAPKASVEKRYFTLDNHHVFQVALEGEWLLETSKLFIGIETPDLSEAECDELMRSKCDWKLASAPQVEQVFRNGEEGLRLRPLTRTPPSLPSGVAYFEFERKQPFWQDVLRTETFGLRFKMIRGQDSFADRTVVALSSPRSGRIANLKFAVFALRAQAR